MKIIALLPVKNEAWVLPSYLSSVLKIADEIIALDDSSTDSSVEILKTAGATVSHYDSTGEKVVNMGRRRQQLLELGRQAGGTHFIWLDADETFSANFIPVSRKKISILKPGQKMKLRWVHLWKDLTQYLDDENSPFGKIYKDFIFCDDKVSDFEDKTLSEGRTPGKISETILLEEKYGVVLHFQFLNGEAMHYKHAWYKCQELIEGKRSARRINATYRVNYDGESKLKTTNIKPEWISNIRLPKSSNDFIWHKDVILENFEKYGVLFFEPLEIWNIGFLREMFISEVRREPKIKTFPEWILILNYYKNLIINFLR